jgi:hypothetical protein
MPSFVTLHQTLLPKGIFNKSDTGDKLRFSFVGEFLNHGTHTLMVGFDDFALTPIQFNDFEVTEAGFFKLDGFLITSDSNIYRMGVDLKSERITGSALVRYTEDGLNFSDDHAFEIYSFGTGIRIHAGFVEYIPRYLLES